jgi:hypothetical protein
VLDFGASGRAESFPYSNTPIDLRTRDRPTYLCAITNSNS